MNEEQLLEKRNAVVSKLNTTIGHLKTLLSEEFFFGNFVKKFDEEKKCGSICCIVGWYPRFYGENTKIFWNPATNNIALQGVKFDAATMLSDLYNYLVEFHGIKEEVITYLFNPVHSAEKIQTKNNIIKRNLHTNSSLEDVIKGWQNVSDLFVAGEMDEYLA